MSESSISSPVKETPECWNDDKRMNVLFSPFRKRELNPVDYDSKMKFWNNIISQWCIENNQCIVNLSTLKMAFKRKGKTPSCLTTVLEELVRNGDLQKKNDFLSMSPPDPSWSGWLVTSVKSPLVWSFLKLKDALAEVDQSEVQYVYLGYFKNKADVLLANIEKIPDKNLFTVDELKKLLEPPECTLECAELLVHWLKLERKASSIKCSDHDLIKMATSPGILEIHDRDIALFKLMKSKESLMKAISVLEEEKEKALNDAKEHISKGLRIAAKSSLRKKKALEECITKRISTLDNLDLLFTKIRDSQSDAEVFNSYKIGLSALKTTFKEAGLSEDSAMDVINNMEEVTEMQDEIQNALSHQVHLNDESELEEELSLILAKAEEHDDDLKLPTVPSTLPEIKVQDKKVEPIKFSVAQ